VRSPASLGTAPELAQAALLGLFTGDALAMPVHWYYRPSDILRSFPPRGITRMEAAPERHPSSIMSLHSTTAAGRSARATPQWGRSAKPPQIVGDVILKGRAHHWGVAGTHYHHGMQAGENTLNTWCARWLIEHLSEAGAYRCEDWFSVYEERVSHDTPSMGALVTVLPVVLALLPTLSLGEVQAICRQHVAVTHPDDQLLRVVDAYVALIDSLLSIGCDNTLDETSRSSAQRDALVQAAGAIRGTRLGEMLAAADKRPVGDAEVVGGRYSLACYIDDSWPSVCWLAARHGQDPHKAQIINANLGGENAHRGAVLGSLSGLMSGKPSTALVLQLHRQDDIETLVGAFVQRFVIA